MTRMTMQNITKPGGAGSLLWYHRREREELRKIITDIFKEKMEKHNIK